MLLTKSQREFPINCSGIVPHLDRDRFNLTEYPVDRSVIECDRTPISSKQTAALYSPDLTKISAK
jgi:hypothetical protein